MLPMATVGDSNTFSLAGAGWYGGMGGGGGLNSQMI